MFVYVCIDSMVLWQRPLALAVNPSGPFRYSGTLAVAVALALAAEATVVAGGGGDGDGGHAASEHPQMESAGPLEYENTLWVIYYKTI